MLNKALLIVALTQALILALWLSLFIVRTVLERISFTIWRYLCYREYLPTLERRKAVYCSFIECWQLFRFLGRDFNAYDLGYSRWSGIFKFNVKELCDE